MALNLLIHSLMSLLKTQESSALTRTNRVRALLFLKSQQWVYLRFYFLCSGRSYSCEGEVLYFIARYRSVTICALVQVAFGISFTPSPCKIPAASAQFIADTA